MADDTRQEWEDTVGDEPYSGFFDETGAWRDRWDLLAAASGVSPKAAPELALPADGGPTFQAALGCGRAAAAAAHDVAANPGPGRSDHELPFHALPAEQFRHLPACTDVELTALGVRRMVVDENQGCPCRVSLSDGEVGGVVYLHSHVRHDVGSPYRSAGPILVREGVSAARPASHEIPLMFHQPGGVVPGRAMPAESLRGRGQWPPES